MAATYDVVFTKSAVDYSYMLRQEGKTKDWKVSDAPLLPQTLITGSASPSNISPEREIQISQTDWRKGFQDFLLEDEHKYYDSENCDARMKGQVILSPKKLTALSFGTQPSIPTLVNANLDTWSDATTIGTWVESGTSIIREGTTRHTASGYSARAGAVAGVSYLTQTIFDTLPAYCKGNLFTFSVWAYGSHTGAECSVIIDDGVGTSESSDIITSDGTWIQGTITRRLDGAATKLVVQIKSDTTGGYSVYMDDAALTCTAYAFGAVVDEVEFGDNIIVAMGNCLFNLASGAAVQVGTFPATITDLCVFENRLYIAQGWSDEYFYTSDLITFTECTLTSSTAKYMANIGGGTFVIADTNSTLRSSDNPIIGGTAFSTQYQVGSDDFDITGLVDHVDTWFVRKEDQVYYLSVADVFPLLPIAPEASTTYTYGLYAWGDCLYIPSGVNSLYEYDVVNATATTISPIKYTEGDTNYDENITAITNDESYLYVCLNNGTSIRILAGRWENVDGDTDWYWHPLYDLTSNNVNSLLISSLSGAKRLYAGTDTYTDGIYPFIVPTAYSNIYSESGIKFEATGTFYTPWFTSNFPTEIKYWKTIDITSICKSADATSINPYYQVKGGGWVAMTTCTASAGAGYPAEVTDTRTIGLASERIRFAFVLATTSEDYTPILYGSGGGIVTFSVLQADRKRQIDATILVAPKIRLRDDTVVERVMATDLTNLRALYKGTSTMTITGPDETVYTVVFAREGYEEQLAYNPTMREENYLVSVQLLEV